MKTEVNKLEECLVEIKVSFEQDEWKKAQDVALTKAATKVQIDGFRKGKAPKRLVKARVGAGYILSEACDDLLQKNYYSIIMESGVNPVDQPQADITKISEDEIEVVLKVTVAPEVTLGEWKGLDVKKKAVRVTKKEIEEQLTQYQSMNAELVIKEEGTVEEGNTAVINFKGYVDGEEFAGGEGNDYPLEIGSGAFIPGFEDQLIGMKAGEEKEINVTFPNEYAPELAGKDAMFKVTVNEIKEKQLPELDDELALDLGFEGVSTFEELEKYTKDQIKARKESESETEFETALFKALVESTPVTVPEVMITSEQDAMMREIEQNLSSQGVTMDLYAQITGKTVEEMKEELYEQAEQRVKVNLILSEIVKAEDIKVSDEELDEEIKRIAEMYQRDAEEVKNLFASQGQLGTISADLAVRKAVDLVKENLK